MADIWPIENIWSYIKEKLKGEEIQDISILKKNCENLENNYSKNMFQFDKLNTKKIAMFDQQKRFPTHQERQ